MQLRKEEDNLPRLLHPRANEDGRQRCRREGDEDLEEDADVWQRSAKTATF